MTDRNAEDERTLRPDEPAPRWLEGPTIAAPATDAPTPMDATALRRGAAIGRYLVLSLLGRGVMGEVYAVYDPDLDRRVALELLHVARGSETARRLLAREARALGKISHPNVVQVHDVGEYDGDVFVAMELVEDEPLDAWCRGTPKPRWEDVLGAYLDAARGLAAVHEKGLIHRDVKPSNILRGHDGRVRVADFGLAAASGSSAPDGEDALPVAAPIDADAVHERHAACALGLHARRRRVEDRAGRRDAG